jgi:hypothetical protein
MPRHSAELGLKGRSCIALEVQGAQARSTSGDIAQPWTERLYHTILCGTLMSSREYPSRVRQGVSRGRTKTSTKLSNPWGSLPVGSHKLVSSLSF